ncbi:glutamate receptor 2.8-like [Fagus crenata]
MDKLPPLCSILVLVFIFTHRVTVNGSSNTTGNDKIIGVIGAIVDNSSRIGKEQSVAMKLALDDFYDKFNQSLILHIRDSQGEPIQAALEAMDLINTQEVQAILGPRTWEETSLVAEVGSQNQIPILSFADTTPQWAAERWPFLLQASPNQFKQMNAIAAIVQSWEWRRVTVIYEDRDSSATRVLPHLSNALREVGVEISQLLALPPFASSSLSRELEKLKEGQGRVFVVHLSLGLAERLFEMAKREKMMGKDYVWITTDPITSLVHAMNASTISKMEGILGVKSYFPETGDRFLDFHHRFDNRFSSEHPKEDNHEPDIFAAQAYDAAWTMALAMRESNQGGQLLLEKVVLSDFNGIGGKVEFIDNKLVPVNIFQIVNVVGRSYRELGFWSDGQGFSVNLNENATYNSSMKALGRVYWPGGPWNTPRGWTLPTSANPLRIGVPVLTSFKEYVNVEYDPLEDNTSYTGFAIDVFKETLGQLPFYLPYNFYQFNGRYNALVEQIHLKNFDAVVGDVTIVSGRYQHAEFTHPYTESGLVMIVPVISKTSNRAWLFMKPFTMAMWLLIGAINVYNGFVIWLLERNNCPELKGSVINQMGMLIWLAFNTLFSINGQRLHSNLSRMAMVVWLFVALVIMQTYTANLTSMLTVQHLGPTVTDIEALKNSNAKIGHCSGSFLSNYLVDVLDFNRDNIRTFNSTKDYADALQNRDIAAAFLEVPLANLFLAKYCKGFTIAGPTYKVGGFGFAFPRGSPLLPSITEALLKVSESGRLRDLENNMIASAKCHHVEPDKETPSLSPNSFLVLFIMSGGTSTLALLVYILRVDRSIFRHRIMWRLMKAAMRHWRSQNRIFSRRVSNVAENPSNSSNTLDP